MSSKAPNHGQKVTPGKDAPVTKEGAGAVASDSLAAESLKSGGGFASNRNAETSEVPLTGTTSSSTQHKSSSTHHTGSGEKQGGTAPSYVDSQLAQNLAGPHGKNIKEGGFAGEGPGDSINAEPGSKNDPARDTVNKIVREQGGGVSAPRQSGLSGEQPYEALGNEENA